MNTKQLKSRVGGLLCGMLLAGTSAYAGDVSVTENITTDTTWTADNTYILTDIIYVTDDAALTIEPGTIIKGEPRTADLFDPGALVITRGAKLYAEGTREEPIIFTSTEDNLNGNLGTDDRGLWGGVILLGNAELNTTEETKFIEGLPLNDLGAYGGNANDDNSGVLRYISIRHGGTKLSDDNEINGLTLGAVGSSTTIEYIEVFANLDDGYEWFGGTVNTKHLISAFCGDDSFDWDQGFRGKGQYWFTIQAQDGNRAAEMDGGTDPKNGSPYSTPVLYNVTYIGSGVDSLNPENDTMYFDDFSGGFYHNAIFTDFGNSGVTFSDESSADNSALTQLEDGNLAITNAIWYGFATGNTETGVVPNNPTTAGFAADFARTTIFETANGNLIEDPMLEGISRIAGENALKPRPSLESPALGLPEGALPEDSFFDPVNYYGAFGPDSYWASGWTALSAYGIIEDRPESGETIRIDADITTDTTWTSDNTYVLTDIIYVTNGASLTIEAGTLIKGEPRTASLFDPGTLVITQGSRIFASGTITNPIVFTSTEDNGQLGVEDRGLWGGLILLGKAKLNTSETPKFIEGLPLNSKGAYGGNDDLDNSGVLRYISIRHGGTKLSDDNEINGLTLGAVGSGTQIDHIEVFANLDDGYEWFGGTVNTKYLVSAFCGDDSFDWDQGFRGKGQFWFTIQAPDGNRAAEMDGGTDPKNGAPYSTPHLYNVTYIGSGVDSSNVENDTMYFDDFSGGFYYNSIFTDFGNTGVTFSDESSAENSALTQLQDGNLVLANNLWYGFAAGNTEEGVVPNNPTTAGFAADFARTTILASANANVIQDPELGGISRTADSHGLDPRPAAGSIATTMALELAPDDGFYTTAAYAGAFEPQAELWIAGWTALDEYGLLSDALPYLAENGIPLDPTTGWYYTFLGTVNTLNAPWYFSPQWGWFYADPANDYTAGWYYMVVDGAGVFYYAGNQANLTTDTGFWLYSVPVSGTTNFQDWVFIDNQANEESADFWFYFYTGGVGTLPAAL